MALVQAYIEWSPTLVDSGDNKAVLGYRMRTADPAQAIVDAGVLAPLLNNVTGSIISGYRVSIVFLENAFVYPGAGVENEDKASITFRIAGLGNGKGNLKIPAPLGGLFMSPSGPQHNIVDITNTALNLYTDEFKSSGTLYISDGEDLDALVSGKRISAKSNFG